VKAHSLQDPSLFSGPHTLSLATLTHAMCRGTAVLSLYPTLYVAPMPLDATAAPRQTEHTHLVQSGVSGWHSSQQQQDHKQAHSRQDSCAGMVKHTAPCSHTHSSGTGRHALSCAYRGAVHADHGMDTTVP